MANHESNDEWSGPSEKKSKQDHFTNDCVPSTRQSAIPNEDIDWEAISSTADFARLATSTPPGLGRGVLRRPETPGRVRDGKRWIYAFTTPSPNQGRLDDIDPWERDETSQNNDHSWENLSSKREPQTSAQLDICDRIKREHEADVGATQFSRWEKEKFHATQWYIMELEILRMQYNMKLRNLCSRFDDCKTGNTRGEFYIDCID
jgi:hypothetical protein